MSQAHPHGADPMITARLDGALSEALETFASRPQVLVALDFDGTLAPIVDDPDAARMTPAASDAIQALSAQPGVTLTVVSGRAAADLVTVADLPDETLVVGSHGVQVGRVRSNPHGQRELVSEDLPMSEEQERLLAEVTRRLQVLADSTEGARVERKPTTAVLHTRACTDADSDRLTSEAVDGPGALEGTRTIVGKKVVEIAVLKVTKGDAVSLLRKRTGVHAVMYIGDDTTDEDAFEVLELERDLSIKVGEGTTAAHYRVDTPDHVAFVLLELLRLRGRFSEQDATEQGPTEQG